MTYDKTWALSIIDRVATARGWPQSVTTLAHSIAEDADVSWVDAEFFSSSYPERLHSGWPSLPDQEGWDKLAGVWASAAGDVAAAEEREESVAETLNYAVSGAKESAAETVSQVRDVVEKNKGLFGLYGVLGVLLLVLVLYVVTR